MKFNFYKIVFLTLLLSIPTLAQSRDNLKTISVKNDIPLDSGFRYSKSFDTYIEEALANVVALTEETEWSQKFRITSWSSTFAAAKEQGMQEMMDEVTSGQASDNFNQLITADYLLDRVVVSSENNSKFEVIFKLIEVKTGKEVTGSGFVSVRGSGSSQQKDNLIEDLTEILAGLFEKTFRREQKLDLKSLDNRASTPIIKDLELSGPHGKDISTFLSASIPSESVSLRDITFKIDREPLNGNAEIISGNKLIYTPRVGFKGVDQITYFAEYEDKISRFPIVSLIKTIKFSVTNIPPTTTGSTQNIQAESGKTFNLSARDENSDRVRFEITQNPLRGRVFVRDLNSGRVEYIPNLNASGEDSFKFRVFDGVDYSNESVVKIVISQRNNPPEAESYEIFTVHDSEYLGLFKGADKDGDSVDFQVIKNPANGNIKAMGGNKFEYTPYRSYVGVDSFDYIAIDEKGLKSNKATVLINVTNQKPVAIGATINGPKSDKFIIELIGRDGDIIDQSRLSTTIYKRPFGDLVKVEGTTNKYEYQNSRNRKEDDIIFYVYDGVQRSDYARINLILDQEDKSQATTTLSANSTRTKNPSPSIQPKPTAKPKPKVIPQYPSSNQEEKKKSGPNMLLILGGLLLLALLGGGGGGDSSDGGSGGGSGTGIIDIGIEGP